MWFDRFDRYYRAAGPERSMLGAYNAWRKKEKKGETRSLASSWSKNAAKWNWKERAEAWDMEQHRLRIAEEERQRADMLRRHTRLARGLQQVGGKRLELLDKKPDELSAGEARQYVKDGVGLERQAAGLPEHLVAVAAMSDDELLQKYRRLLTGISGAGSGDGPEGDPGSGDTGGAAEEAA